MPLADVWVLRSVRIEDAAALWECERALAEASVGMVLVPSDLGSLDAFESGMLSRMEDRIWHGAEIDGRLVGEASITPLGPSRCSHVGILAVGIHPAHQGDGIGRALCTSVVEAAREAGLLRIELYVRADNTRAIRLYQSLGFDREGCRKRFVRTDDGDWVDDLIYVRFL